MPGDTIEAVKHAAIDRYVGDLGGLHGLAHWERVRANGERLSDQPGVDGFLVRAFAYLHDCCRENDGSDYDHGLRAARFAASLGSQVLPISADSLELLCFACEHHAKGFTSEDPTVGACWDSDRLDLGRVGAVPDTQFLSTPVAKTQETIDWAYQRSLTSDTGGGGY